MGTVREHESESQSQKPMHDGNKISGTAHDSDFKGPALTDEEAVIILLQICTSINLLPASSHPQRKCGSQTRKWMHDNSEAGISGTASYSNGEPKNTTPKSIHFGSGEPISATLSHARNPMIGKTNPTIFNGPGLDGKITDTASGMEFSGAGGWNTRRESVITRIQRSLTQS